MNRIIGIDLAWGERKPDGVCVLEVDGTTVSIRATFLCRGDKELMESVAQYSSCYPTLLAVDAPLVCPNLTGARPVDRLTHVHFGKFYAGSHPANLTRCLRPVRVTNHLVQLGFRLGWTFSNANDVDKLMVEVYPHPAMVRLFNLKQRIAYKRGPVAQRL